MPHNFDSAADCSLMDAQDEAVKPRVRTVVAYSLALTFLIVTAALGLAVALEFAPAKLGTELGTYSIMASWLCVVIGVAITQPARQP